MNEGGIVQCGSPWEIYFQPHSAFVASFVGTANLLEGRVVESIHGGVLVDVGQASLRLEEKGNLPPSGAKVILCIRPETIEIVDQALEGSSNIVPGRVRNTLFEGSHFRYWVEAAQRELVVDVFDPAEKGIKEGSVLLRLPPNRIHIIPNY
jgi:ABC-type Fe3+/spermidine/putrescine transport system ATPase subunit